MHSGKSHREILRTVARQIIAMNFILFGFIGKIYKDKMKGLVKEAVKELFEKQSTLLAFIF